MFSLSSKWLKELQEYSQVLVKEEMFLSRVETIQEEINILKTKRLENGFSLINQLRNDLKKVKTKNICIFAGGGIDSNLLILLCNEILNNKEISIFSIQTKDNRNDISQLRNLSKILKINHHIFRLEENDINDSLNYFFQKNKRYPRDEAYPGIFKLVNEGAKRFKDTTFMDGQYADTYTFSNPQNIYQIIWRFLPSIKINKIGYMRKSNKIVSLILGLLLPRLNSSYIFVELKILKNQNCNFRIDK